MTQEEILEEVIKDITEQLRRTPFTFEFKVVKKPKGIKIIHEVTQEQMDMIIKQATKMKDENGSER